MRTDDLPEDPLSGHLGALKSFFYRFLVTEKWSNEIPLFGLRAVPEAWKRYNPSSPF
jgi:hypothetical protein